MEQRVHRVSVTTQYTEHGTTRTGIYSRKLRTPLLVVLGNNDGILTDRAASPYVTVGNGTLGADETVRIQVILDLHEESCSSISWICTRTAKRASLYG